MRFDVITLFPEVLYSVCKLGVVGRARLKGILSLFTWNPRDFTQNTYRRVDDRTYGGGPGMVMMAEPLEKTLLAIKDNHRANNLISEPTILLTPSGRKFDQDQAKAIAACPVVILVCGRYEGIDQRFIEEHITQEVSLGDFILSGGEIGALAIIDAITRLLPGSLNNDVSSTQDSFSTSLSRLLEGPHYTRPKVYQGRTVPNILLSGHHVRIAQWRRRQSLRLTAKRRPDLIADARVHQLLTEADELLLKEEKLL